MLRGELQQPAVKSIHPSLAETGRQPQRNEAEERFAAHGGQIGQTTRKSFVADVRGSVRIELEVPAFKNEIGCKDEVMLRFRADDRTIVTDASNQTFVRR
jgi:hypothetical protein